MATVENPQPIVPPSLRPESPRRAAPTGGNESSSGDRLFGHLKPPETCRYVNGFRDAHGHLRRKHACASCSVACYEVYASLLTRALHRHLQHRVDGRLKGVVLFAFKGYLKFVRGDCVADVRRRFVKSLNKKRRGRSNCSIFAILHVTLPNRVHYDFIALATNTSVRAVRELLGTCWQATTRRPFQLMQFEVGDQDRLHALRNYLPYLTKMHAKDRVTNWNLPKLGPGQRLTMHSGPLFAGLRIKEDSKIKPWLADGPLQ